MKKQNIKIKVKGVEVAFVQSQQKDFICITNIAKFKNSDSPRDVIKNWMRTKNKSETNYFVLSPQKWIENKIHWASHEEAAAETLYKQVDSSKEYVDTSRDLCINMNNHQNAIFHQITNFLKTPLSLLGVDLKNFQFNKICHFANHPYLCKGLL